MLQAVNTSNHQLKSSNITWKKIPLQVLCDMANKVLDGDTRDLLEYRHLFWRTNFREAWGKLYGNELGWFAQGMPGLFYGMDTILLIRKQAVPINQLIHVTYGNIVFDYKNNI